MEFDKILDLLFTRRRGVHRLELLHFNLKPLDLCLERRGAASFGLGGGLFSRGVNLQCAFVW